MTRRRPMHELPVSQQAGILCGSEQFRRFAAHQLGIDTDAVSEVAAAEFVRTTCDVLSRRHLNTDSHAAARFAALRTEFDAWRGRLAPQR